jgi:protein-disulfide isomerase
MDNINSDSFSTESTNKKENLGNSDEIKIKKSTYNNLLKTTVVAIAIATFIGGYSLGTMDTSNSLSNEDLKDIISEINSRPAAVPQPAQQPTQPNAPQVFKISLDDDPVKGDPDAPVTIVEFSDFQCPFCGRFYEQTLPSIVENYIDSGKVKLVYRDLPLSFHSNAKPSHIAAECADEQGKFWDYHDILFEKQSEWQSLSSDDLGTTLSQYASDVGIQTASFENCMTSSKIADEVEQDSQDASIYGATGTPTFFIGNEKDGFIKLTGAQPYGTFQSAFDEQLG